MGRRKGRPIQIHLEGRSGWEGWQLVTFHLYHPEHVKSFRTGRGPYERKATKAELKADVPAAERTRARSAC
jgi:hypothetical protein